MEEDNIEEEDYVEEKDVPNKVDEEVELDVGDDVLEDDINDDIIKHDGDDDDDMANPFNVDSKLDDTSNEDLDEEQD